MVRNQENKQILNGGNWRGNVNILLKFRVGIWYVVHIEVNALKLGYK